MNQGNEAATCTLKQAPFKLLLRSPSREIREVSSIFALSLDPSGMHKAFGIEEG